MADSKPKQTFLTQLESFRNRKKTAQEGVKIPQTNSPKTLFNGGPDGKK